MLQVLDAVDPIQNGAQNTVQAAVNRLAQPKPEPESLADVLKPPKPSGQRQHGAPNIQETEQSGGGHRTGWSTDCKDLAQRLLFSEDSEEAHAAQAQPEPPACTERVSHQKPSIGSQLGTLSK